MTKKYSIKDCKYYARLKGGDCLSQAYNGINIKMAWKCKKGHVFYARFNDIKKGSWCKVCYYNSLKVSSKTIKKLVKEKGGDLLSTYRECGRLKLKIKCKRHNFIWNPRWDSIKNGNWCPKCGTNLPLLSELNCFVNKKNGKLIDSTKYFSAKSPITVKCNKDGYKWNTTWDYLKQGKWCPKCAGKILLSPKEFKKIILNKGGSLLSTHTKFKNSTRIKIKCHKDGYIWETSYYAIIHRNTWCPKCARCILRSFKDLEDIVKNKGGKILSSKDCLKSSTSKLEVECKNHHRWFISYANLIRNKWCPRCCTNKMQEKLANILSDIFNTDIKINYRNFDWLKNKRNMEIDIWIPKLKLAIEYDGEQHFIPVNFGNDKRKAIQDLKKLRKRDALKDKLILEHSDEVNKFIRFNYTDDISINAVKLKLQKNGIKIL